MVDQVPQAQQPPSRANIDSLKWPVCTVPGCGQPNITKDPSGKCLVCRMKELPHEKCRTCPDEFPVGSLKEGRCGGCRRKEAEQIAGAERVKQRLTDLLGGEEPYERHTWARFKIIEENQAGYEAAQRFDPENDNLYIHGTVGGGKTFLAHLIARTRFPLDRTVVMSRATDLFRRLSRSDFAFEPEEIKRLAAVDTLIVDDLGAGTFVVPLAQRLLEIVNVRREHGRNGLVITTNLSLNHLADILKDDRLPSRLNGVCRVIEVTGPKQKDPKTGETRAQDWRKLLKQQTKSGGHT